MSKKPTKLDISDEMIAERRGGSVKMPKDMPKWMANTIVRIDKFSKKIGKYRKSLYKIGNPMHFRRDVGFSLYVHGFPSF